MSININNSVSFAPTNNGNGTHLEAAVKAKELAEEKGEMAIQLIESTSSSANSNSLVSGHGHNINIKV